MRRFFEPASMPAWLKPVLSSIRAALGDVWDVPLRPFQAETAMLPPAADHQGGIVYDATLDKLLYSNRIAWLTVVDTTGAAFTGNIQVGGALSATGNFTISGGSFAAPAEDGLLVAHATATDGGCITGRGSSTDFVLINKNGDNVFAVPTGTRNIGFGTSTPATFLDGTSGIAVFDSSTPGIAIANSSRGYLLYVNGSTFFLWDSMANADRLVIDQNGNFGLNTADFGSGTKVMGIPNASAVPSANPTGGGVLYCEGGALKYRGSSGTVTTLGAA